MRCCFSDSLEIAVPTPHTKFPKLFLDRKFPRRSLLDYRGSETPLIQRRLGSSLATVDAASSPRLTHVDDAGRPAMVDVSPKLRSKRTAVASGRIYIPKLAYELIVTPHDNSDTPADNPSYLSPLEKAKAKSRSKGDVLTVAQLAAIMGSKRTSDLIPLCHPLQLSHISVKLLPHAAGSASDLEAHPEAPVGARQDARYEYSILCVATVSCEGKTGVEMEALTAVSVGLLTVWDMLKAVAGKEMTIGDIMVLEKQGGKSGDFLRTDVVRPS